MRRRNLGLFFCAMPKRRGEEEYTQFKREFIPFESSTCVQLEWEGSRARTTLWRLWKLPSCLFGRSLLTRISAWLFQILSVFFSLAHFLCSFSLSFIFIDHQTAISLEQRKIPTNFNWSLQRFDILHNRCSGSMSSTERKKVEMSKFFHSRLNSALLAAESSIRFVHFPSSSLARWQRRIRIDWRHRDCYPSIFIPHCSNVRRQHNSSMGGNGIRKRKEKSRPKNLFADKSMRKMEYEKSKKNVEQSHFIRNLIQLRAAHTRPRE